MKSTHLITPLIPSSAVLAAFYDNFTSHSAKSLAVVSRTKIEFFTLNSTGLSPELIPICGIAPPAIAAVCADAPQGLRRIAVLGCGAAGTSELGNSPGLTLSLYGWNSATQNWIVAHRINFSESRVQNVPPLVAFRPESGVLVCVTNPFTGFIAELNSEGGISASGEFPIPETDFVSIELISVSLKSRSAPQIQNFLAVLSRNGIGKRFCVYELSWREPRNSTEKTPQITQIWTTESFDPTTEVLIPAGATIGGIFLFGHESALWVTNPQIKPPQETPQLRRRRRKRQWHIPENQIRQFKWRSNYPVICATFIPDIPGNFILGTETGEMIIVATEFTNTGNSGNSQQSVTAVTAMTATPAGRVSVPTCLTHVKAEYFFAGSALHASTLFAYDGAAHTFVPLQALPGLPAVLDVAVDERSLVGGVTCYAAAGGFYSGGVYKIEYGVTLWYRDYAFVVPKGKIEVSVDSISEFWTFPCRRLLITASAVSQKVNCFTLPPPGTAKAQPEPVEVPQLTDTAVVAVNSEKRLIVTQNSLFVGIGLEKIPFVATELAMKAAFAPQFYIIVFGSRNITGFAYGNHKELFRNVTKSDIFAVDCVGSGNHKLSIPKIRQKSRKFGKTENAEAEAETKVTKPYNLVAVAYTNGSSSELLGFPASSAPQTAQTAQTVPKTWQLRHSATDPENKAGILTTDIAVTLCGSGAVIWTGRSDGTLAAYVISDTRHSAVPQTPRKVIKLAETSVEFRKIGSDTWIVSAGRDKLWQLSRLGYKKNSVNSVNLEFVDSWHFCVINGSELPNLWCSDSIISTTNSQPQLWLTLNSTNFQWTSVAQQPSCRIQSLLLNVLVRKIISMATADCVIAATFSISGAANNVAQSDVIVINPQTMKQTARLPLPSGTEIIDLCGISDDLIVAATSDGLLTVIQVTKTKQLVVRARHSKRNVTAVCGIGGGRSGAAFALAEGRRIELLSVAQHGSHDTEPNPDREWHVRSVAQGLETPDVLVALSAYNGVIAAPHLTNGFTVAHLESGAAPKRGKLSGVGCFGARWPLNAEIVAQKVILVSYEDEWVALWRRNGTGNNVAQQFEAQGFPVCLGEAVNVVKRVGFVATEAEAEAEECRDSWKSVAVIGTVRLEERKSGRENGKDGGITSEKMAEEKTEITNKIQRSGGLWICLEATNLEPEEEFNELLKESLINLADPPISWGNLKAEVAEKINEIAENPCGMRFTFSMKK